MAAITCTRCGKEGQPLPFAPFNNELGKRIHEGICNDCWQEWLRYQTMLINHYGLNLQDPEARKFLKENTEKYLFGGDDSVEEVDTSKQGTIQW